jgi:hypothetical protein
MAWKGAGRGGHLRSASQAVGSQMLPRSKLMMVKVGISPQIMTINQSLGRISVEF